MQPQEGGKANTPAGGGWSVLYCSWLRCERSVSHLPSTLNLPASRLLHSPCSPPSATLPSRLPSRLRRPSHFRSSWGSRPSGARLPARWVEGEWEKEGRRASLLQTACLTAISSCRLLAELHSPTHASPMCYCSPSAAPPPRPSQLPARPPSKPAQQVGAPGQASRRPLRCAADGVCAFTCAIKYAHICVE